MLTRSRTLNFSPMWEGAIQKWAAKFIRQNRWRCDSIHSSDDLLQDAYLTFMKIAERYPRVHEAKHFMRLYQVALRNEMHEHSRYVQRKRNWVGDETFNTDHEGYLGALIAEAPEEIQLALACYQDDTKLEVLREPRPLQPDPTKLRQHECLNRKLRRLTGASATADLVGGIRALLT